MLKNDPNFGKSHPALANTSNDISSPSFSPCNFTRDRERGLNCTHFQGSTKSALRRNRVLVNSHPLLAVGHVLRRHGASSPVALVETGQESESPTLTWWQKMAWEEFFSRHSVASAETELRVWTLAPHPRMAGGVPLPLNYGIGVGFQKGGNWRKRSFKPT